MNKNILLASAVINVILYGIMAVGGQDGTIFGTSGMILTCIWSAVEYKGGIE